jgi:hypothetical protein
LAVLSSGQGCVMVDTWGSADGWTVESRVERGDAGRDEFRVSIWVLERISYSGSEESDW